MKRVTTLTTDYFFSMGCKGKEEELDRFCSQLQPLPSVHVLPHAGKSLVEDSHSFDGLSAKTSQMQSWVMSPRRASVPS